VDKAVDLWPFADDVSVAVEKALSGSAETRAVERLVELLEAESMSREHLWKAAKVLGRLLGECAPRLSPQALQLIAGLERGPSSLTETYVDEYDWGKTKTRTYTGESVVADAHEQIDPVRQFAARDWPAGRRQPTDPRLLRAEDVGADRAPARDRLAEAAVVVSAGERTMAPA
jgi:hypothetical protein